MTIFRFVLKRFLRNPANILLVTLLPIAVVFMPPSGWFPLPMGFQYFGMVLMFIAARMGTIVMEDRIKGTLLRIGLAPVKHSQYLWQTLAAFALILVGVSGIVVALGTAVHGNRLVAPGTLFLVFSCFSIASLGFSLAWFSLFRNREGAVATITGVIPLMMMLGGIMWPVQAMPSLFQRLAMLVPTYWLTKGLLSAADGARLLGLGLPLGLMLLYSAAFVLLGSMRRLI
ncbi:MAG: ABC transporter permease [Limnochordia bacterium]|jgi:ABC-2 type transport system permease protein|nr:MAG: multidrug ABC transporter permease [Peptococcaceae bacterium 1109]